MALRANMLLQGVSGVRWEIVERLVRFVAEDATPVVGQLGSIGASGDLVPLATIGRAITGQGGHCRVVLDGETIDGRAALRKLDLDPLSLLPKEALALINGTSFSTAIAANCVQDARNLFATGLVANVMMIRALCGHEDPFLPFVHQCKPHPGQLWVASIMHRLLTEGSPHAASVNGDGPHVQDRYSLRCLPQYLGPIAEGLTRVAETVETEMNSVTDNPLIDLDKERFCQSGNFLGQYVGIAMDDLLRYLGLMAKHLDVQIALLVSPEFSHGLPASLKGNDDLAYNMGLKGLQITGNSIMPMLTYYGNPLVDHFPTHAEQFNQNVNGLSWGAANLATQSIELFTQYAALSLVFAVQSVDLRTRLKLGHYDGRAMLGSLVTPLYETVYEELDCSPGETRPLVFNDADQSLELYLAALSASLRDEGALVDAVAPIRDTLHMPQP